MDEPELPPLPTWHTRTSPPFRKRSYADFEIDTSSEPALFSSDDHDEASAELYASKRRKEKWTGTWWGDRLRMNSTRRKKSFKRNYDSGIFMGSEGSDTSLEDQLIADQQVKRNTAASSDAASVMQTSCLPTTQKVAKLPAQTRLVSPAHLQAVAIIQRCLEEGSENVDLSSLHLEKLPSEISSLKSLTKHNHMVYNPPTQRFYSSIEAWLLLYLANNSLTRLPTAILELGNLRLLSLRQNNITHIPAGIRRLVNLVSLNLAANNLRCLPFEIRDLLTEHKLMELILEPNPWEQYSPAQDDSPGDEVGLIDQRQVRGRHAPMARIHTSKPTFFHANGTSYVKSNAPSAANADSTKSRAPHLTELILRRLTTFPEISSLDNAIVEELPETAQHMIAEAQDAQASGGRQCTKCHRDMVMPRKQWLEWWSMGPGPGVSVVPFLRQQCHELCDGVNSMRGQQRADGRVRTRL